MPGRSLRSSLPAGAGALAVFCGLGFGLPCAYGAWYLADTGEVWTLAGYPTYSIGPFESIGVGTTVPLLLAFLVVCLAEVHAGWLLVRRHRSGGRLALWLLPVELAFWIGFALPFGPVLGLARTALVVAGWPALNGTPGQSAPDLSSRT